METNKVNKISIITITFNSEKTLEETIKSVLSQNYSNLEYIIIDGGSTDSTLEIINKYRMHIDYFISEQDNGISDAFNKGISIARGTIVGIINSDDMLYKEALYNINNKFMENPNLEILHGNVLRFNNNEVEGRVAKPDKELKKLKYDFLMYHPSVFILKRAYKKYGLYDCRYRYAMDYELISRMYYQGACIEYIDCIISCFRVGGCSEVNKKDTRKEHKKIILKNGGSILQAEFYMLYKNSKTEMILFIKKIGLENFVRNNFRKTDYLKINI